MRNPILKKWPWIGLLLLIILFMAVSYFSFSPEPKPYPSYVSDSPSPSGIKGFYTYLENASDVKRWTHRPSLLPHDRKTSLLIMAEPHFIPDSKEMAAYIDFMKAGNTILLLMENPNGMFDVHTDFIDQKEDQDQPVRIKNQEGKSYKTEYSSVIRLVPNRGDQILLDDVGGPIALGRPVDQGNLIVSAAPQWVKNGKILNYEHLNAIVYLVNTADFETVLFDEYIHSGENASSVTSLYPMWFLLLMIQGAIFILLWLWIQGKRFGPIYTPREESVRFSDEGIRALASWFIKGRRYHDSLIIQNDYVKLLLQERFGMPYSKSWQDMAPLLEKQWQSKSPAEIKEFLLGLEQMLQKPAMNKKEYQLWSIKLDQLRREAEEE